MARSLLDLFPVPRNLRMPAVGLDVSDDSVKIVELKKQNDTLVPVRYASFVLPVGTIEKGVPKNVGAFVDVLHEVKRQYPFTYALASFPEEQGYLVRLKIASEALGDIRGAIDVQLEEHVPLQASEAVFDYEIVGGSNERGEKEVSVSVLSKSVVDAYVSAFDVAKIFPLALNVESQASARAVIPRDDNSTHMIVDFGGSRTNISIVDEGVVRFSSTAPIGSIHLTDILAKSLNISREEADREKFLHGLSREFAHQEMFSFLAPSISVLRDEINKHYYYWQSRRDQQGDDIHPIESVLFIGGGSNLRGLIDYLSYDFEVPVVHANVWKNVPLPPTYVPPMTFQESLGFAPAIGMALFGYDDKLRRAIVL